MTSVTDEDLELLEQNPVFALHKANGFITVEAKEIPVEKVVSDMEARDEAAPLTESDFIAKDQTPPTVVTNKKSK